MQTAGVLGGFLTGLFTFAAKDIGAAPLTVIGLTLLANAIVLYFITLFCYDPLVPYEIRQSELEAKIGAVLRGHYKDGVMGKGGVGRRPYRPVWARFSPSSAKRIGWSQSMPTPRSASSAAASTRRLRGLVLGVGVRSASGVVRRHSQPGG